MKQPETDILVFVDTDRRESQLLEFESQFSFWQKVENLESRSVLSTTQKYSSWPVKASVSKYKKTSLFLQMQ